MSKLLLLLYGALGAVIALALVPERFAVDDAFITFRYAENFSRGLGLVFNVGEWHLGVTAPFYGLLLGAVAFVTGLDVMEVAVVVWVMAGALFAMGCRVLFRDAPLGALAVLVAWVVLRDPLTRATIGMESPLFVAVCIWALVAFRDGRGATLGVLLGIAGLTRPDAVFLAAVLFGIWLVRRDGALRPALVAISVVAAAWCAWSIPTYGSPVPATVAAKAGQARSGIWAHPYGEMLVTRWLVDGPIWLWVLTGFGILSTVVRRERTGLALTLWFVAQQAAYSLVGVPAYPWYYVVFLGQAAVLAAYGIAYAPTWLRRASEMRRRWPVDVAALLGLAALLTSEAGGLRRIPDRLRAASMEPAHAYVDIGRWMQRNTPPEASIACIEVGMLGYYAKRPLADFLGLVSSGIAPLVPDHHHVDHVMRTQRPDYVLAFDPITAQEADLAQHLLHAYEPVDATWPGRRLYRRVACDEETLARRVAAVVPDVEGRLHFGDFPAAYELGRFADAFRPLRPRVDVVRWPNGEERAAIVLDPGCVPRLVPFSAGVHYEAAALREWMRSRGIRFRDDPGGESWFVESRKPYAFIHAPAPPGPGPFRGVRIRLHVHDDGRRGGAGGRVWWQGSDGGTRLPDRWTALVVPRVGEPVDVIVRFPDGGIPATQRLELLRLDLLDLPGEVRVLGVWLDRT